MKTIHDLLMQCQKRMTLKCFKANVKDRLELLLKQSCNVDLSNDPYSFVTDGGSIHMDVTVNYKFKYGNVSISAKDNELKVTFFFDYAYRKLLNIPLNTNCCIVNVDHDLNFIEAKFYNYFLFSREYLATLGNNHQNFIVMITHTVELEHTYNSLFYNVSQSNNTVEIKDGVDERFYIKDSDFESFLLKFMAFVANSPNVFYIGFPNYPSYNELVTDPSRLVHFINMFIEQYFNDNAVLVQTFDQHLLLLDMEDI